MKHIFDVQMGMSTLSPDQLDALHRFAKAFDVEIQIQALDEPMERRQYLRLPSGNGVVVNMHGFGRFYMKSKPEPEPAKKHRRNRKQRRQTKKDHN